jgi:hypothetical protein
MRATSLSVSSLAVLLTACAAPAGNYKQVDSFSAASNKTILTLCYPEDSEAHTSFTVRINAEEAAKNIRSGTLLEILVDRGQGTFGITNPSWTRAPSSSYNTGYRDRMYVMIQTATTSSYLIPTPWFVAFGARQSIGFRGSTAEEIKEKCGKLQPMRIQL